MGKIHIPIESNISELLEKSETLTNKLKEIQDLINEMNQMSITVNLKTSESLSQVQQ